MPAQRKAPGNGGWGISWADVAQAHEDYEAHSNCTIEWRIFRYKKYKAAGHKIWSVVCHARWARDTPKEVCGQASCEVGTGSGAATFPGAVLHAMLRACEDLENRRLKPREAQTALRLPGLDER